MNRILLSFVVLSIIWAAGCDDRGDINSDPETPSQTSLTDDGEVQNGGPGRADQPSSQSSVLQESVNYPPRITSVNVVSVSDRLTDGFRAQVEAVDNEQDEIYVRYEWSRNGEEITAETDEVLDWQEGFKKGDVITVSVTPYDAQNKGTWITEGSFTIPNSPPLIVSEPAGKVESGRFSYTVQAEDPDGDSVYFTLKEAPKGMTIEPATGLITWEFDEYDKGEYNVEIIASDVEGAQSSQELTLNISSRNE